MIQMNMISNNLWSACKKKKKKEINGNIKLQKTEINGNIKLI